GLKACAMLLSAALVAPYDAAVGKPTRPVSDPISTIWPARRARIEGTTPPMQLTSPMRLTFTVLRKFSTEKSSAVVGKYEPALKTARSTGPNAASICRAVSTQAAASVTSSWKAVIFPGTSAASVSRSLAVRALAATIQPVCASRRASARPMPLPAPVTHAVPLVPSIPDPPCWMQYEAGRPEVHCGRANPRLTGHKPRLRGAWRPDIRRPSASPRSRPHDHPARPYPQFLHRRPYRPREIHAGRPPDPDHGRARGAGDEGAGARFDGYRARARHHHQGADGAPQIPRAERRGLHPQPHRHARPCRLRLRGQPLARGGRGQPAGGGRHAGRRGADARQRLSRDGGRPRDRPRHQQG